MKRKKYMVFCHIRKNGTECWTAYTTMANPLWDDFVGHFEVECKNWSDGERKAIKAAKDCMGRGVGGQAGKAVGQ